MPCYDVEVTRTATLTRTFAVEAHNPEDALEQALDLARQVQWALEDADVEYDAGLAVGCPECSRSYGPRYDGPCEH